MQWHEREGHPKDGVKVATYEECGANQIVVHKLSDATLSMASKAVRRIVFVVMSPMSVNIPASVATR